MEELIQELREKANENIANSQETAAAHWGAQEGVLLSNAEALQICAALEIAMHPTAVMAALSRLNYTQLDPVLKFAAVDIDSGFYAFDEMPEKNKEFGIWHLSWVRWKNSSLRSWILNAFNFPAFDWEQMLFERTSEGWQWVGNKQTDEENGK